MIQSSDEIKIRNETKANSLKENMELIVASQDEYGAYDDVNDTSADSYEYNGQRGEIVQTETETKTKLKFNANGKAGAILKILIGVIMAAIGTKVITPMLGSMTEAETKAGKMCAELYKISPIISIIGVLIVIIGTFEMIRALMNGDSGIIEEKVETKVQKPFTVKKPDELNEPWIGDRSSGREKA